MMESYSLPTDSPLAKPGISQQSSLSSKLPYTPHPLQTGRKSSHDELEIPAPKPSLSTDEKRREEKNMEEKARFSKLGNALQQQKSASSTKLLPPSYRNDPMRVASTHKREYAKPELSKKITSKASRLGNIDLESFLKDDRVWDKLKADQQQRLIKRSGLEFVTDIEQLPNGKWPNIWKLAQEKEHIALDEVVEKFQRNLRAGKLDPEWRANAKSAAVKRARGDFVRQDTLDEEGEEDVEDSSSEESSEDDEWMDKFEDDLDVEMEDVGTEGEVVVKKIPKKLSIKIYED